MKKTILIIEDEPDLLQLATLRLEKSGYEVAAALNSKQAFDLIAEKTPDLILLDLLLSGERGEEICKRLKSDSKLKKIPIIIFSASACDISVKLEETQADDYIIKPFDTDELLGKIKKFIVK
jgi:DNA-binding response OmpR family regulator